MRFHTYTKFSPEMADAVDLQALLDKLADFLLQSGFAGGNGPYQGFDFGEEHDRSLDALKKAILEALIESGQFTPEMLEALRGDGNSEAQAKLAKFLDDLVLGLVLSFVLALVQDGLANRVLQFFKRLVIAQIFSEIVVQFRQFLAGAELPPAVATSPKFYGTLLEVFRQVVPLIRFLNQPLRPAFAAPPLRRGKPSTR